MSLDLQKDNARPVKDVVVGDDTVAADLGAIDPSDDLLFTLKLRTTAEGPLSISASATSVSIIGDASDASGDVMVVEVSGNSNDNDHSNTDPEEELTNLFGQALDIVTANYCGTMGLMPLGVTAMLLIGGTGRPRGTRRRSRR